MKNRSGANAALKVLLPLTLGFLLQGCGKPASFSAGSADPKPLDNPATQPAGTPSPAACSQKTENVLIIDLKSGWWEGDGFTTFQKLANYLSNGCATIHLDYKHITEIDDDVTPQNFPPKPYRDYDEIWVLSGADYDGEDISADSPMFQSIVAGITGSSANLMLGGGSGAIYHSNEIAKALGLSSIFQPSSDAQDIIILNGVDDDIRVVSSITGLPQSPYFSGITSLPDSIRVNGDMMRSDIVRANPKVTPLLSNAAHATEIATATIGQRKIFIDADLARYYPILNHDENVGRFFTNVLVNLER